MRGAKISIHKCSHCVARNDIFFKNSLIFACAAIFFGLVLFFVLSFGISALQSAFPSFKMGQNSITGASGALLFKSTLYTFVEAILSTFVALVVGFPAAFLLARRTFFGKALLRSCSAVPLCVPAFIVALGYISTFGRSGIVTRALSALFPVPPSFTFLYSLWGIVLCQGFYNFPLVMRTVSLAWQGLDQSEAESARLLGATEARVFCTITLPALLPAVCSACIPIFLYSFFSFVIVQLFAPVGVSTLEVLLYQAARSTVNLRLAGLISLLETVTAFTVLFLGAALEEKTLRGTRQKNVSGEKSAVNIDAKREMIPFILYSIVIGVFFVVPFLSIIYASLSTPKGALHLSVKAWKTLFSLRGFLPAVRNTICTALGTSILCTVAALFYATCLKLYLLKPSVGKNQHIKNDFLLRTLALLPMAVSSVVMAVGLTLLVKRGSPLVLIFAQAALSWPFAFRHIYSSLITIPNDTLQAALLLSPYPQDLVFGILLPQAKKSIISAACFCFAISAGEATLPYVLAVPHYETLSILTYRLASSYRFAEAGAAGSLLALLCIAVFSLSYVFKAE